MAQGPGTSFPYCSGGGPEHRLPASPAFPHSRNNRALSRTIIFWWMWLCWEQSGQVEDLKICSLKTFHRDTSWFTEPKLQATPTESEKTEPALRWIPQSSQTQNCKLWVQVLALGLTLAERAGTSFLSTGTHWQLLAAWKPASLVQDGHPAKQELVQIQK